MQVPSVSLHLCTQAFFGPLQMTLLLPSASSFVCPTIGLNRPIYHRNLLQNQRVSDLSSPGNDLKFDQILPRLRR
jgi:hypothetical protein